MLFCGTTSRIYDEEEAISLFSLDRLRFFLIQHGADKFQAQDMLLKISSLEENQVFTFHDSEDQIFTITRKRSTSGLGDKFSVEFQGNHVNECLIEYGCCIKICLVILGLASGGVLLGFGLS